MKAQTDMEKNETEGKGKEDIHTLQTDRRSYRKHRDSARQRETPVHRRRHNCRQPWREREYTSAWEACPLDANR